MGKESEPKENATIDPITLSEVASIAKSRIKKDVWDYYECGADSQTALHENEAAFKASALHIFVPSTSIDSFPALKYYLE